MSDKKKPSLCKPPVPARPKNLVVLNSKHLPKPPETFSTDKVTNFIKDLNLDIKGEENVVNKVKNLGHPKPENLTSSDVEEDSYGYLEPTSLSDVNKNARVSNGQFNFKKPACDENSKFGEMFKKAVSRNNSISSGEIPETDESKPHISQSQWQRPLPLPPVEIKTEASMPWYKNVDRKKGEEILRNGVDGYFLVRPSSNADTYLTLTLWYNKRVYNIPIRKRKDGKFALGTPKTHEQCFDSIEYLVKNYQSEKLVLYSNGVQTGRTLLTTYPP